MGDQASTQIQPIVPVKNRLGVRLLLVIVLCSSVITAVLTVLQLYRDYDNELIAIEKRLQQVGISVSTGLAEDVWVLNTRGIQNQLQSIVNLPDIVYCEVITNSGLSYRAGKEEADQTRLTFSTELYHRSQSDYLLGFLEIDATKKVAKQYISDKIVWVLLSEGIKIFIFSFIILLIVSRMITRHLNRLAGYAESVRLQQLDMPLTLNRKAADKWEGDEFDQVVAAINSMRSDLLDDIDSLKEKEQQLREGAIRLQLVMAAANVGWWDWNILTNIVHYSSIWKAQIGYQENEIGDELQEWSSRLHPDDEDEIPKKVQAFIDHPEGDFLIEFRLRHKDGSYRWIQSKGELLFDGNNTPYRFIGCHVDITDFRAIEEERVNRERERAQSQKLEALGTLAGGIAHDFNNVLQGIMANTELLELIVEDNPEAQKRIQNIASLNTRGAALVKEILTFSRMDEQEKGTIDLAEIITEVIDVSKPPVFSEITVNMEISDDVSLKMYGNRYQIQQVFENLYMNALQSMEEKGGAITVRLAKVNVTAEDHLSEVAPGFYIRIDFIDTGEGISQEVRQRLFEPFFTTKPVGKGTGLGLAIVHGIVKSHDGAISVSSISGEGTTFSVYLPYSDDCEKTEEIENLTVLPAGRERILFVDDEIALLEAQTLLLEQFGYQVTSFSKSPEALKYFQENPKKFDLLITDQTMPVMDGLRLIQEIKKIRPALPVILCTGYAENISNADLSNLGFPEIINKPLSASVLQRLINRILNQE